MAVEEVAEDGTDDERRLDDGREVDAHADGERRQDEILRRALEQLIDEDQDNTQADADVDILPREFAGEDTLCDGGHEHGLGRGECLCGIHARTRHGAGEAVCLVEEVEHGGDDQRTNHAADEERGLLAPRRCSDEPARLEILHIVVRDAGDREDDRGGKDGGCCCKFLTARQIKDAERGAQRVHDE